MNPVSHTSPRAAADLIRPDAPGLKNANHTDKKASKFDEFNDPDLHTDAEKPPASVKKLAWALAVFVGPFFLVACSNAQTTANWLKSPTASASRLPARQPEKAPVSLAISGFNYTALPIDLFSVDSIGGGNLLVSTTTSGGGGSTCCYELFPSSSLPYPVEVRWMRDFGSHQRWCRTVVTLTGPLPEDPTNLAVHFLPDGEIRIEVTHGYPTLLLALKRFDPGHRGQGGNVIHDEEKASCRDEQ